MKSGVERYTPLALIVGAIAFVYRGWLAPGVISYGDWSYYSSGRMRDFWLIPSLWEGSFSTGSANILSGPMFPLLFLHGFLNELGVGFAISERLIWIFPGVLIGALATYVLAVTFFSRRLAGVVSGLFAMFNSYIGVIMTGGQFTVSAAYGLMPLVLLLFYRALNRPAVSRLLLTALCLSIQIMFDLRTTYLTLGVVFLFSLYFIVAQRSLARVLQAATRISLQIVVMAIVGILMHAYWLLPGHYAVRIALPVGYDSTDWVARLSYMQLSHAFALFHPFWYQDTQSPYVAPVAPVFYLLPLVIFAVLLRSRITFVELCLASIALLAIFFVKGDNPPAGALYDWFFSHMPGFNMYRDPSKFFQPLGLAYALLLGKAATVVPLMHGGRVKKDVSAIAQGIVTLTCAGLVLIPVMPVATSTSWGTLAPQSVPVEYVAFDRFIDRQQQFFRVMWYPNFYPFASYSSLHPVIGVNYLGQPASWVRPQARAILQALSVKYVVVPDYPGNKTYQATKDQALQQLRHAFPTFPEIHIGGIHLFLNRSYLPAVFVPRATIVPSAARALLRRAIAPPAEQRTGFLGEYATACHGCLILASRTNTRYEVIVRDTSRPFLLVLNQSFDPNWAAYVEPSSAPQPFWWTWTHRAIPYRDHLHVNGFANAWWISAPGIRRIVLEYWPQRLTDVGFVVCWLTILGCMALALAPLVVRWRRRRAGDAQSSVSRMPPPSSSAVMDMTEQSGNC